MRKNIMASCLLGSLALTGCGDNPPTDPSKLPALSASDLEEIKKRDEEVAEEEGALSLGKLEKPKNAKGR